MLLYRHSHSIYSNITPKAVAKLIRLAYSEKHRLSTELIAKLGTSRRIDFINITGELLTLQRKVLNNYEHYSMYFNVIEVIR